ncbi:MAG: hypothetical protein COA78_16040 [Blastopirellula sp.]|nr:MAG: hypothetical protein COA78_16040 [Blastopirellula sp.]
MCWKLNFHPKDIALRLGFKTGHAKCLPLKINFKLSASYLFIRLCQAITSLEAVNLDDFQHIYELITKSA